MLKGQTLVLNCFFFLFILGLLPVVSQEFELQVIDTVPKVISYKGTLQKVYSWSDIKGKYVLVISSEGPVEEIENKTFEDENYMGLYVSQYVLRGGIYSKLWSVFDFERHCPYNLDVGLLHNGVRVTDLDGDGVSETTLVYKLTCSSDISPSRLKVLMHVNNKKMGLRGLMRSGIFGERLEEDFNPNLSKVSEKGLSEFEIDFIKEGRYHNEADFEGEPNVFLKFAKSLWLNYVLEDGFHDPN